MDDKLKIAGVLLGGYLLGRTKKLKTAVLLGAAVAGNRLRDESARGALMDSLGGLKDEQPAARIRYVGPWPPYSFADVPDAAAPPSA